MCDRLFKKFKIPKLCIDKEIYKVDQCEVQILIPYKTKVFCLYRICDTIDKPKEILKGSKILRLT